MNPKMMEPAFPMIHIHNGQHGEVSQSSENGMTIRTYIATAALQGLLAKYGYEDLEGVAERAIKHADALLAKLGEVRDEV